MPYHTDQADERKIVSTKRKVSIIDLTPEQQAEDKKLEDKQYRDMGIAMLVIIAITFVLCYLTGF